jgi:hypothetical protein
MIGGRDYLAHRLAYLYMTGKWPNQIDHSNYDKSDNRWENLRECSREQNFANSYRHLKGVSWHHGKWRAEIKVNGRRHYLGRFDDPQEGALAYATAACAAYGEFAHPRWRDVLAGIRGVGLLTCEARNV